MSTSGKRRARRSAKKQVVTASSAMPPTARQRAILIGVLGTLLAAMVLAVVLAGVSSDPNRVWSAEHGHWHDANGQEIP